MTTRSQFEQAIRDKAAEKASDFLCTQIRRNESFVRNGVPDPLGTFKALQDIQVPLLQNFFDCPNEGDADDLFGGAPPFEGGQCDGVTYTAATSFVNVFGTETSGFHSFVGKVLSIRRFTDGQGRPKYGYMREGFPDEQIAATGMGFSPGAVPFTETFFGPLLPSSGVPDECGDPPGTPGAIDQQYDELDSLPLEETTVNYDFTFDYGGDIGEKTIQLPFSNISIDNSIPFEFSFDVGGQRFRSNDEGTEPEPPEVTREKDKAKRDKKINDALDNALDVLSEIKECVCDENSNLELETAVLALAECSGEEGSKSATKVFRTLQVLKDSVTTELVQEFDQSAELGLVGCECDNSVSQENAMEIFSGIITDSNSVVYSPVLDMTIRAVVLTINDYDRLHTRIYRMAGPEAEGDYGWMAVSADQFSSGGHVTRLVSKETYLRLPESTKPNRIRLSLRKGTSFTLWDTGERGRLWLPNSA